MCMGVDYWGRGRRGGEVKECFGGGFGFGFGFRFFGCARGNIGGLIRFGAHCAIETSVESCCYPRRE